MEQIVVYLWGTLAVIMVILELVNPGVLQIWFAIGAISSAIVAWIAPENYALQMIVFLVVSAILAFIGSKFFSNKDEDNPSKSQNPVFSILGKQAIVTKEINNLSGSGQITVGGETWSAKSNSDEPIAEGTKVNVLEIEGVKAVVEVIK